jgi:hypothetical protein
VSALLKAALIGGTGLIVGSFVALAQSGGSADYVTIDQNVDQATLDRYHYTDQGTRLVPAAWLAALEKPDGSGKVMNPADLRKYGFLVDNVPRQASNPYGWPLGWTVSDPAENDGIAIAGFTCAMCHTGRIDYQGTSMIIEGGQPMIDLFPFVDVVVDAFVATATDRVMKRKFITDAIAAGYPADRMKDDFNNSIELLSRIRQSTPGVKIVMLPGGPGRVDAVQGIANRVFATDLDVPTNQRNASAPVSYPYLWDIWRLSWLQYSGFLPSAPDFRNIGEVLGTEGKTNLVDDGGNLNPEPLRWRTSVQIRNLHWMEGTLRGLKAPMWPENVLGPIDRAKAGEGRALFAENCAGCHGIKTLPDGRWDVAVVPLDHVGTDPAAATNFAGYTYDLSKIGLSDKTPSYQGLEAAVSAIRNQLYVDNDIPEAEREPAVALQAPCGYKARPLIGVWATPPFLHNGAVRTVYDLLSDTRPSSFRYGTREYDPVKLGYTEDVSENDAVLDTAIPGNRNTGHWWTNDMNRPGRIGRALSDDEKYALIEYLKAATYENYPSEPRATPAKVACQDRQDWALSSSAR